MPNAQQAETRGAEKDAATTTAQRPESAPLAQPKGQSRGIGVDLATVDRAIADEIARAVFAGNIDKAIEIADERLRRDREDREAIERERREELRAPVLTIAQVQRLARPRGRR